MSQTFAPISDITVTNFTGTPTNSAGNRYQNVDEAVADDADYVYSTNNTIGVFEVKLASMTDPVNRAPISVGYRIANTNAGALSGTAFSKVTPELYQGTTLIAAFSQKTTTAAWVAFTSTLSNLEANAITDWTDLRVRFTTTATASRGVGISYVTMTLPDAATATDENQLNSTESFGTGWTKTNCTIAQDVINSPSIAGAFNADMHTEAAVTSSDHSCKTIRSSGRSGEGRMCFSCYFKDAGRGFVYIRFENGAGVVAAFFANLSTGAMTTISADNADYTGIAGFTRDMGDGWWLVSVTAIKGTSDNTNTVIWFPFPTASVASYLGDVTKGLYIWGARLNAGTIPATYIRVPTPTTKKLGALGVG